MSLKSTLGKIGKFALKVFSTAQEAGLTDELLVKASGLVTAAKAEFEDNTKRREWAVAALKAGGVKESIARLAIELALQSIKGK